MSVLLVERSGALLRLRLNRPDRSNALDAELVEALLSALEGAATDGVRLVVFEASGARFCTGFDLSGLDEQSDGDLALRFLRLQALLEEVQYAPYLTVATAEGAAYGAGADLFCACRWRIAAPEALFCMPGLKFGVVLGTRMLVQRIGAHAAYGVLSTSAVFDADEALANGFVTEVTEPERWPQRIAQAANEAQKLAPDAAAALCSATTYDTRIEDRAALAQSVSRRDFGARLRRYRNQVMARPPKD